MASGDTSPSQRGVAVFSGNRVLQGKYKLGRMLGEGGMGTVYQAEHIGLRAQVAVKLLAETGIADQRALARFAREAKAMGAIRHENVVSIMDTGADENGVPFLVMELLRGESLASMLRRERTLDTGTATWIMRQILAGLGAAHRQGIIHRDLKPGNIFLARRDDGSHIVKVLDFGISKLTNTSAINVNVTADGALVGTPNFMAPEQIRAADIDHRVDIYAAGVIMYRMVAGALPYAGVSPEDLYRAVLLANPKKPSERQSEVAPAIEQTIMRAMHPDREQRFKTTEEFQQALDSTFSTQPAGAVLSHLAIPRKPRGPIEQAATRKRWNATLPGRVSKASVTAAGALIAVAMISTLLTWLVTPSVASAPPVKRYDKAMPREVATVVENRLRFGITRFKAPDEISAELQPLIDHLSDSVDQEIELIVVENYTDLAQKLLQGEIDIAGLSAAAYVRAKRRAPKLEILATPVTEAGDSYEGYILVRRNSGIRQLTDLKGKVFCYVGRNSASGYLYPRALLREAGLDPDRSFTATRFTKDHIDSLRALAEGGCDGAAVYALAWLGARNAGIDPSTLSVIARTAPIPWDAYVVSGQMPKQLRDALRESLLELEPNSPQSRAVFGPTTSPIVGFRPSDDIFYDGVRRIEKFVVQEEDE